MPDYRRMYFKLFSLCLEMMEALEQATLETEEMAMEENAPTLLPADIEEKGPCQ